MRVGTWAVMSEANHPKPILEPICSMISGKDWVCSLHAQNKSERRIVRITLPLSERLLKLGPVLNHSAETATLQQAIIGELPLRSSTGDLLSTKVDRGAAVGIAARKYRGQRNPDLSAPHFRKRDRSVTACLIRHTSLSTANLGHRPS